MHKMSPPCALFGKTVTRSHLKFDLNTGTDVKLPQPVTSIYEDLMFPANQLLTGPDAKEPLSLYTLSYANGRSSKPGLLKGTCRALLGAD